MQQYQLYSRQQFAKLRPTRLSTKTTMYSFKNCLIKRGIGVLSLYCLLISTLQSRSPRSPLLLSLLLLRNGQIQGHLRSLTNSVKITKQLKLRLLLPQIQPVKRSQANLPKTMHHQLNRLHGLRTRPPTGPIS